MHHKITITGNLGRDPELKYMSDGKAVASFTVAVTDGFGDKKKTIWFKVSVWGKPAENANQYLRKGSTVLVEGKLVTDESGNPRTYTAKDGTTRSSFEMNASEVVYLTKAEKSEEQQQQQPTPATQPRKSAPQQTIEDDDIPF